MSLDSCQINEWSTDIILSEFLKQKQGHCYYYIFMQTNFLILVAFVTMFSADVFSSLSEVSIVFGNLPGMIKTVCVCYTYSYYLLHSVSCLGNFQDLLIPFVMLISISAKPTYILNDCTHDYQKSFTSNVWLDKSVLVQSYS